MSSTLKVILIILAIAAVGVIVYFVFFANKSSKIMPGSDRDAHGCIGSAGYSWCAARDKCLRTWEEECK